MRLSSIAHALCIALIAGLFSPNLAEARSVGDCKARWGSAVRSYLTKNQRADPQGKVPANLDEAELVAQAWIELFGEVCRLETSGKKRKSRLMAATIGTATLARLDPLACQRFLHYFMKAKDPEGVCQAALDGPQEQLGTRVAASLKHHRRLTVPWVNKR